MKVRALLAVALTAAALSIATPAMADPVTPSFCSANPPGPFISGVATTVGNGQYNNPGSGGGQWAPFVARFCNPELGVFS